MLFDQKKLDLYVEKNLNVLMEGEKGIGKTSIIKNTFEKAGYRVKYFSASTMDPWTDLIGVPQTVSRTDGKEVLRFVPPEDFVDDKYDVIFIDELNRAKDKVMNALMELIQFKTINGKPYNIKMIWAAINPHTENNDYHVEPLDPAVKDRFHVHISLPYELDRDFFKKKHGPTGIIFCDWWDNQPEAVRKEISPRRLSDAAEFHLGGGDFRDMIRAGNVTKLRDDLRSVSQIVILEQDLANGVIGASKTILNKNYSTNIANYLKSHQKIFEFFLPAIDKEWLAKEFTEKNEIYEYMLKISESESETKSIVNEIITDIVSINPGKNNFVRKNLAELEKYLNQDDLEFYKERIASRENSLHPQSAEEATFIKGLQDYRLMTTDYPPNVQNIKVFNWTNMHNITDSGLNYARRGKINLDRVKQQISERVGIVLANVIATKGMNDSLKKTIDSLTSDVVGNSSYIWRKKNIDSEFSDMGKLIKGVLDKYDGCSAEEIKQAYVDMTINPNKKKAVKPVKPTAINPGTKKPRRTVPTVRGWSVKRRV